MRNKTLISQIVGVLLTMHLLIAIALTYITMALSHPPEGGVTVWHVLEWFGVMLLWPCWVIYLQFI